MALLFGSYEIYSDSWKSLGMIIYHTFGNYQKPLVEA